MGTSGRSHWQVGCAGLGFPNSRDMRALCGRLGSVIELARFLYIWIWIQIWICFLNSDLDLHLYLGFCDFELEHLSIVEVGGGPLLKTKTN